MLITASDIQTVIQLSDNLPPVKINPMISRAQELDLKPQLGAALYKALVDGFAASPQEAIYLTLMNGEAYTFCQNETIDYPGLTPALAWYSYARYLSSASHYSTVNGIVMPTPEHSEVVSDRSLARQISEARTAAEHYIDETHQYLCEKSLIYPLYKGDKGKRRRGKTNITAI